MGDRIVTRHHKIDWSLFRKDMFQKFHDAAKYYIDADVVGLLQREDGMKSVEAMVESGICNLPYNPMMIEFQATDKFRWFILLEETPDAPYDFKCQCVFMHLETEKTYYSSNDAEMFLEKGAFRVNNVRTKQDAHAAICAVTMGLLLLNTRGIQKEVIYPEKLNTARVKKGVSPIPLVTTLRIGSVYDRSDKAVNINGGTRHMRVHLRAGYSRRQHFGVGNSETKMVYIPPCLVNYRPENGDKVPALPQKRIVL